jgi:glycosyltransferase involved in cell wall biosynthesis
VVEALACGRPVVASDVGGLAEIVNDSCGILTAPRDIESLRSGLERSLNTPWDHAGIAHTIRRTWDDVASETLAVCEQVMQARRRFDAQRAGR